MIDYFVWSSETHLNRITNFISLRFIWWQVNHFTFTFTGNQSKLDVGCIFFFFSDTYDSVLTSKKYTIYV